jgi:hypothetical protein
MEKEGVIYNRSGCKGADFNRASFSRIVSRTPAPSEAECREVPYLTGAAK